MREHRLAYLKSTFLLSLWLF